MKIWKMKVFQIGQSIAHFAQWKPLILKIPFKIKSTGRPPRLLRFRGRFRGHLGQNFKIIYFLSLFTIEFLSFWVSRSFDLGNLGVLRKSPVNIFNDHIFEISGFHWSKCTIKCAICLILISKSAQARCECLFCMLKYSKIILWFSQIGFEKTLMALHTFQYHFYVKNANQSP